MALILAVMSWGYFFSCALSLLNVRHMESRAAGGLPAGLRDWIEPERLVSMVAYNKANAWLGCWGGGLGLAVAAAILLTGLLPWLARELSETSWPLWLQGMAALFVPLLILHLSGLPASLASSFGIEKRFGFSTITPKIWAADQAKGLLVSGLLMGLLFFGFYIFIGWLGNRWWLPAWGLVAVFSLLIIFVAPVWLAPLFNKFAPVADQELKESILELAKKARFPLAGVFQMDASRRSTHDNAYFTGLGRTRRIVFYDTMLRSYRQGELLAVLGHEIGHWKLGHIPRMLAASVVFSGAALFLTALVLSSPWFYRAIGLYDIYSKIGLSGPVVGLALVVASMLFSPLGLLFSPLTTWLSRQHEYQADAFSLKLRPEPGDLKSALRRLGDRNLSNLFPHPWYVAFHYSHPPLLARLEAIDNDNNTKLNHQDTKAL
jgi:STE24 endopeptidase